MIKRFNKNQDISQLALFYNATTGEIRKKLIKLGYIKIRQPIKTFSQDEIDFIIKNHKTLTTTEMGKILNRATSSIFYRVKKLGLKTFVKTKTTVKNKEDYLWQWKGF